MGSNKPARPSSARTAAAREERVSSEHLEAKLDEALEETFPASDPIAVDTPASNRASSAERRNAASARHSMIHEAGGRGYPPEAGRIEFLLMRDGHDATVVWIQYTIVIYRRAVLNKKHFASTPQYRRQFIGAYCDFKRWLGTQPPARGTLSRNPAGRLTPYRLGLAGSRSAPFAQ